MAPGTLAVWVRLLSVTVPPGATGSGESVALVSAEIWLVFAVTLFRHALSTATALAVAGIKAADAAAASTASANLRRIDISHTPFGEHTPHW